MSIHNPHDHFFRESFGRPEIVRSYLVEYLPADLQAELNLDDLTLQDGSFIDEELKAAIVADHPSGGLSWGKTVVGAD
jgi:predicted transposase YdaD